MKKFGITCCYILLTTVTIVTDSIPSTPFRFTLPFYNVSIPENSVGKTYAVSIQERVGIQLQDATQFTEIKYKITNGDKDKIFKAEEKIVGDFCFLFIRTRTGNTAVLNRERKNKYVLDIKATALKKDGKSKMILEADTIIEVKVLDTNDLNPLFYPTEYEAVVPEDMMLHKSIVKVMAEDADLGINGEIYYSFLDDNEQFMINPTTGVISLTRRLKFVEKSYYELIVLAQDRGAVYRSGSVRYSSRAKVKIRVKQVNLYAPEIKVRHLPKIIENSYADIYAIINVTDKDYGTNGEVKNLEIVSGDPDGHFRIKPTKNKGEYHIEILKILDRETSPQGYQLKVRATDKGSPPRESYKSLPVQLTDLNDNPPVFNKEIYDVKVFENVPINTPLIRLKVTDRDEGKNAQVYLQIVGGNEGGEFHINPESGVLYTAVKLDAEQKAFYSLTVSAIDQGNIGTRKQSSAKVKINVIDRNDNDPVFEKPETTIWINENEPAGTSITKVIAKDRDSGENAYISYSIVNLHPVPFEIDPFTGIVKTTQLIDYESMRRKYILRLRASDWGLPYRRQAEMQLTIKIKDINDNRPQFEKTDCMGHVPRFIPIGSEIITLSAVDFDAGNIISYRIVSGNEDGCFALDATSGTLSVSCDLTELKTDERLINVTATDGTNFADIISIHFFLVDIKRNLVSINRLFMEEVGNFDCKDSGVARRLNEILSLAEKNNEDNFEPEDFLMMPTRYGQNIHSPEFIDFPTEIKVNESVNLGTTLTRIKARDRDLGYNGKLNYVISQGDDDSVFCVDTDTGDLKIIGYLDREKRDKYLLNITILDLGRPQKSTSRSLPITVVDVNDNAPRFEKTLASFRVAENALNGTVIFTANATDADIGENAKVTYSLTTDTRDFSIDPTSGVLFICNKLDRERQDLYELKIRATDNGGRYIDTVSLHSEALVRILIDDINDNAPKFSLKSYNIKVREDIPKGTVVATITAFDPDIGPEGEILYSLQDEDNTGSFKIDKHSGTIRTTKSLDYETSQVHTLKIIASDLGTPSLSSQTQVTIVIVDVNENVFAPVFSEPVVTGSVSENRPTGTVVMKLNATDNDAAADDSKIGYSIRGGDGIGYFTVNNEGVIQTSAILDAETRSHFWLTIVAQDHGVVPLHSSVQVYIEVLNENDNVPLSDDLVYYGNVLEDSPAGLSVVQIRANDADKDTNKKLNYKIISGNHDGYFNINNITGLVTTTSRRLDREHQNEIILEILISDDGEPSLSSTTRAIITVEDINDHSPEFEQQVYTVHIPASVSPDEPLFKNGTQLDIDVYDGALENTTWQTFGSVDLYGERILRVLAYDKDVGNNAEIQYSMKTGRKMKFRIHNSTGIIHAQKRLEPGTEYELHVRAMDLGTPQRWNTCRVVVKVVPVPISSRHAPQVRRINPITVTESDRIGFLVALIQAVDKDNDTLWYDIIDGDPRNEFYIGRDNGNVLLAKQLDWEIQNEYSLNISITDGVHTIHTRLNITVMDINDHRPEFSQSFYHVEISESISIGTEVLRLQATDKDSEKKLVYSFHTAQQLASLNTFKLDSITGSITLATNLDRELISSHLLIVSVRDGGTPSQRNYCRVLLTVHDHNDHAPQFTEQLLQGKVYESAAVGSVVLQALAQDRDKGENARISYSITSGNTGNLFVINPSLGTIHTARELDVSSTKEFTLHIRATDFGNPPLSTTVPAHIMVTMADNSPPKFVTRDFSAEIYEDHQIGSYVKHLEAKSSSSLTYEIIDGNLDDTFSISPSTGVIITRGKLDYEAVKSYNLTVKATNMASATAICNVLVHILDKNDNAPIFLETYYEGSISEAAPINSLILDNSTNPLIIKAFDADSEINSLLNFEIIEPGPRRYFRIDSTTGAVRTIRLLDFELHRKYLFHVKLTDLGKPKLTSDYTAKVLINIDDVNDCTPLFTQQVYNVTIFLPTYKNVTVIQLNATDPDIVASATLSYNIIEGNQHDIFHINTHNGIITVLDPEKIKQIHKLQVRVSDGKFSNIARVNIRVEESDFSGLRFQQNIYTGFIVENSTKITTVCVVDVLGTSLNEHVEFRILNPTELFEIGLTSGVIRTTGHQIDREQIDNFNLVVEAISQTAEFGRAKVAHVIVNITILDINDNCPVFVNLPYYAVASVTDPKGTVIAKVHAVDIDAGENGEVRYELIKGHGELFKVSRKTGNIELKQNLEGHNKEYQLLVAAYDGGNQACRTDVAVHVKVVDTQMPVFKKQVYSDTIPESIEINTPLAVSIEADSPQGRKLIYDIIRGNDDEEFSLDFNSALDSITGPCIIIVKNNLDYERKQNYELQIRATDPVSGMFSEVPVYIYVQDVNDCVPEFVQDSYNVSVPETIPIGSTILQLIIKDNDTGINSKVLYSIRSGSNRSNEFFAVDPEDGTVFLKQSLDHEQANIHHFLMEATDQGIPSLSTTAHVWVSVLDVNDNPPRFEQLSFSCGLSVQARRGQFVTVLRASDPDITDLGKLRYKIISGNEAQIFSIHPKTGIVTLTNLGRIVDHRSISLNVSVSDGVHGSFARLKINLLPANMNTPAFPSLLMEGSVLENKPSGQFITVVKAVDEDFGEFGTVSYSIHSDYLKQKFHVDKNTGRVTTNTRLDREEQRYYELPIMASDGGGKSSFITLRIKVVDENDNVPQFDFKEYKASIYSNLTIGMVFLKVRARDLDEGNSEQVEYSIYETQNSGVLELFAINPETGGIFLLKTGIPWENQLFQFFVRARDNGKPPLYTDVPVTVYIMASGDQPPLAEKKDDKYFVSENSLPGTVITRIKILTNSSVRYKIISDESVNGKNQFVINENGTVLLGAALDAEVKDHYLIGVLIETDTNPPLTSILELRIQVLDENDNYPYFESNTYTMYVAENIDLGSSVLKVIAHDVDKGRNGELRYSFATDSLETADVFSIDAHSGWITNLVRLDKETKSEYRFHVTATDNGHPKHSARATVIIKIKDSNDQPSLFKRKFYEAAVNEDAWPGTVIIHLETTDGDLDLITPVSFHIISGDPLVQYQIRQTGEIYVSKPLDRETLSMYELEVLVTDGLYTDITTVKIDILDANDNPPYCVQHRFRHTLSEGVPPGTYILTIQARDIDDIEHSKLIYTLTGVGSEYFQLDRNFGHLKTSMPLDRETVGQYSLTAHVQDRDNNSSGCSSHIEIDLTDLNDNTPQFSLPYYTVSLPEDVEVGSFVTRVYATDADAGVNQKIKYVLLNSSNNHFKIITKSGVVTLNKPLDREQKALYNLTVKALDMGSPQLSSTVNLLVNVQDINDNPPEFTSKQYHAIIPENEPVESDVVRVIATSKDTGVNAYIFYSIVSGNEHRRFKINERTGMISISELLDYEKDRNYMLTVRATDGGDPPLINMAKVNITITDINDNPPVFRQVSYTAKVKENSPIGEKVIQVIAVDVDSKDNSKVSYTISNGNIEEHFDIDPLNGFITVSANIDREKTDHYTLEVTARDNGTPSLSKAVIVNVIVLDVNDNPPKFSQNNYTAIIQEDKSVGHPFIKFLVTDEDIPPNGAPYTFDFISGNEAGLFHLDQDGVIRTATRFIKKVQDEYYLHIRAFDNGTKPLYSDAQVVVKIIEESQYPPLLTPLEIFINSYLDEFPGGVIGRVIATDKDKYDTLTYSFFPTLGMPYPITELFEINKTDGTLTAYQGVDYGEYQLNISVTDGKYFTNIVVPVTVEVISEETLENSVVLRLRSIRPQMFVRNHRKDFIRAIRNIMNSRLKDVVLISIQPSSDEDNTNIHGLGLYRKIISKDLDILFAIRKNKADAYYSTDEVRKALNDNLEELEESTKLVVEEIIGSKCSASYCSSGICRDRMVLETLDQTPITTDTSSFVAPKHQRKLECVCKEGFDGDRCDTVVNNCAHDPCPIFKICVPDTTTQGFSCQCPEGFIGNTCEIDILKCYDESCYVPRNPVSFSGKSYAQYKILNKKFIEKQQNLSLRIRTLHPTGNLMYASGKVDYNILEIINGTVQYRFNLGTGEGTAHITDAYVSDGRWHEIRLERDGNSARLTVDNIHVVHGSSPGASDVLNLQEEHMYLGAEVHRHPSILGFKDIRHGYTGCMDDVRLSRNSIPLHVTNSNNPSPSVLIRFSNVEFSCSDTQLQPAGPCGSQPCQNGGSCTEIGTEFDCQCHVRFKGVMCEIDSDPCASQPCLYGGRCRNTGDTFSCDCPQRHTGKRCEYGHYCNPNPCKHGAACEEGDTAPLCKCRSFAGELCDSDINECDSSPCFGGGTCINEIGSYRCICPYNMTGLHCNSPVYHSYLTYLNITMQELFGIIGAVGIIIFLVIIFIIMKAYCTRTTRHENKHGSNIKNKEPVITNCVRPPDLTEFERGSKISNLDLNIHDPPICPPRPLVYKPSQNDPLYVCDAVILNNIDTLRECGTVEEDLENVSRNYLRNLNCATTQVPYQSSTSSDKQKTTWTDAQLTAAADVAKIKNDLKSNLRRPYRQTNVSKNGPQKEDTDTINSWTYRRQNLLSKISEASGSEASDTSSYQSSDGTKVKSAHSAAETPEVVQQTDSPNVSNCPSPTSCNEVEPYGFPSNRNRIEGGDTCIESILLDDHTHKIFELNKSSTNLSSSMYDVEDSGCESEQKCNFQQTFV